MVATRIVRVSSEHWVPGEGELTSEFAQTSPAPVIVQDNGRITIKPTLIGPRTHPQFSFRVTHAHGPMWNNLEETLLSHFRDEVRITREDDGTALVIRGSGVHAFKKIGATLQQTLLWVAPKRIIRGNKGRDFEPITLEMHRQIMRRAARSAPQLKF